MTQYMLFFFQAEDGIRDGHVTGVQTCALPIFDELVARWNERRLGPDRTETAADLGKLSAKVFERFDLLAELTTGHSFVERRKVVTAVAFFRYSSLAALILALALSMGITLIL